MRYSIGVIVPSTIYPTYKSIRNPRNLEGGKDTRQLFDPFKVNEEVIIIPLEDFRKLNPTKAHGTTW